MFIFLNTRDSAGTWRSGAGREAGVPSPHRSAWGGVCVPRPHGHGHVRTRLSNPDVAHPGRRPGRGCCRACPCAPQLHRSDRFLGKRATLPRPVSLYVTDGLREGGLDPPRRQGFTKLKGAERYLYAAAASDTSGVGPGRGGKPGAARAALTRRSGWQCPDRERRANPADRGIASPHYISHVVSAPNRPPSQETVRRLTLGASTSPRSPGRGSPQAALANLRLNLTTAAGDSDPGTRRPPRSSATRGSRGRAERAGVPALPARPAACPAHGASQRQPVPRSAVPPLLAAHAPSSSAAPGPRHGR